ncbi:MAG: hypothetical protein PVH87_02065 [Desulfobacteraceae bacterium]|jgi:hypothetical protein
MKEDSHLEDKVIYSGSLLSFFIIAYTEFNKEQKNLKDFSVTISEDEKKLTISFSPKLKPGERILGGKTSLGRGVTFYISKTENKIIRRLFHR